MADVVPQMNLDDAATPWGRWVTENLKEEIARSGRQETEIKSQQQATAGALGQASEASAHLAKSALVPRPPVVSLTTSGYFDTVGAAAGRIVASWSVVTKDPNDIPIDVNNYEVWMRPTTLSENINVLNEDLAYRRYSSTRDTTMEIMPLDVGREYAIRVRAVSVFGTPGGFSREAYITTAPPTVRLDPPTKPSLTTRLGVVMAHWDGLLTTGAPPSQFSGVYAEVGTAETGPYNRMGTQLVGRGQALIDGLEYKTKYWVRFRATDSFGGTSDPSVAVQVEVKPLVDTDIIGEVINGANIVPGSINAADKVIANSVTGALIEALTIKAGHLDSNSVTTDKVLAGSITGIKVAANTIETNNMRIGDFTNLWPNEAFIPALSAYGFGPIIATGRTETPYMVHLSARDHIASQHKVQINAGDSIRITAVVGNFSSVAIPSGTLQFGMWLMDAAGNASSNPAPWGARAAVPALNPGSWTTVTTSITIPAGVSNAVSYGSPYISLDQPASGGPYQIGIANMFMRRMTSGSLIVDGAIDGKTITGAIVRTSATGQRTELSGNNIKFFSPSGSAGSIVGSNASDNSAMVTITSGGGTRVDIGTTYLPAGSSTGFKTESAWINGVIADRLYSVQGNRSAWEVYDTANAPGIPTTKSGRWTVAFSGGVANASFGGGAFPTTCASVQLTSGGGLTGGVSVYLNTLSRAGLTIATTGGFSGVADIYYTAVGW